MPNAENFVDSRERGEYQGERTLGLLNNNRVKKDSFCYIFLISLIQWNITLVIRFQILAGLENVEVLRQNQKVIMITVSFCRRQQEIGDHI